MFVSLHRARSKTAHAHSPGANPLFGRLSFFSVVIDAAVRRAACDVAISFRTRDRSTLTKGEKEKQKEKDWGNEFKHVVPEERCSFAVVAPVN